MRRTWKQLLVLPLIATGILAGCEAANSTSITAPVRSPSSLVPAAGNGTSSYSLVRDPLAPGLTSSLSSSRLIGIDGGQVSLLGHTLTIPGGAVRRPTLFTLTVLPTGYVEVDLTATRSSVLGLVMNVGPGRLLKPIPVTLTYSRAYDLEDPTELFVARTKSVVGYGRLERLPSTVDLERQTVTSELDHFSRYALAMP